MRLTPGTRAIVTGASRGIGRALAERLAGRGVTVGLLARSARELEALADALPGEHVVLGGVDVGDRAAVEEAVGRFVERAGGVDLAIANAGVAFYEPVAEQPLEPIETMTRVNWLGTVHLVKAVLPHLLRQGSGHLVVVSSGAGLRSFPHAAVYGATKAAQRGFASALWHELAGTGVSVTTVFPGEVETALHEHEHDRLPDWRRGRRGIHARAVADATLRGIERDRRHVYVPREVRALRIAEGISPALADALLRRLRGPSSAPRRR